MPDDPRYDPAFDWHLILTCVLTAVEEHNRDFAEIISSIIIDLELLRFSNLVSTQVIVNEMLSLFA